jgi:hypothetical protein
VGFSQKQFPLVNFELHTSFVLTQLKRTKKKYKRDLPQFATISDKREIFKFP